MKQPARILLMFAASTVLVIAVALAATPTAVASRPPDSGPQQGSVNDEACLACHDTPGMQTQLPSGEVLYLEVDRVTYKTSTHGRLGYACVQCHTDITGFPHPEVTAQTRREFTLQLYASCASCHQDKYRDSLDGVHAKALAAGNQEAAVCTDCHGAHNVGPPDVPRTRIAQTCERCHSQIYARYKESVHGAALIGEGNPDVPTCIDCHGVHNVQGPDYNQRFHLFSPQLCAECHADEALMSKYGISTAVFDTYVSDFHGTTVVLFEKVAPDQETNKPVCVDCHGVHDILSPDDPRSTVMQDNLLKTCQKCHPDATADFPASWLSHYQPGPEKAPLVYYVNLFYKVFIPTVIGGMLVFVATDAYRRIARRRKEARHG